MGGAASRNKGSRAEREIVQRLVAAGFAAQRVPLSGAAGGQFGGDVVATVKGERLLLEVKVRGTGFRQLYDWLESADALIVRADRKQPLVVVPFDLAVKLLARNSGDGVE